MPTEYEGLGYLLDPPQKPKSSIKYRTTASRREEFLKAGLAKGWILSCGSKVLAQGRGGLVILKVNSQERLKNIS